MRFTIDNPMHLWFLLSIPVLILLHFYSLRFTRRRAIQFANFEALKRVGTGLRGGQVLSKNYILLILRVVVIVLIVCSLCQMKLWYVGKAHSFDYVLAIDASGSMLADDLKPNRMDAAKESALNFIDLVEGRPKIAVMSFAGVSFIKLRLNSDKILLKEAIRSIPIEYSSGTAVGEAIVSAANLFENEDVSRAIILLTDGQSTVGIPVSQGIKYAKDNHVIIHTIGIGTEEGGSIAGMLTTINDEELNLIASETGGNYYRVSNKDQLKEAYSEIATSFEEKLKPLNLSIVFLIVAFIILFIEWTLVNTKYRTIP
jgi:Ca-activated chloride channel homolog